MVDIHSRYNNILSFYLFKTNNNIVLYLQLCQFFSKFAHKPISVDDRQAAGLLVVGVRQHFNVTVAADHCGQTFDWLYH